MKKTIIICIDEGFVQKVHTDLPEDIEIAVRVMDEDCRSADPDGAEAAEYDKCADLLAGSDMRNIYEFGG